MGLPRSPTTELLPSPLLPPLSLLPTLWSTPPLSSMLPLSLPMPPQSTPPVDKQLIVLPNIPLVGILTDIFHSLRTAANSPIMKLQRQRLNKEDRTTKYATRILTFC